MPTAAINFTKARLDALQPVPGARVVVRDLQTPGLELRVSPGGAKTFSLLHRIKGNKVERVTLGRYSASYTITRARDDAKKAIGKHTAGVNLRQEQVRVVRSGKTVADALQEFIDDDSARKNGAMKDRTRLDYLNMLRPAGKSPRGHVHGPGELHSIAAKPIQSLTSTTLKALNRKLATASVSRAAYAMRVTRAVLRYHGVTMDDDPFAAATAKVDRIIIPQSGKRERIVPLERLDDWWHAASATAHGDAFQLLLLTGMRRGELDSIQRRHVNLEAARIHLADTKNHKPHVIYLSKQALVLVRARAANKEDEDFVFAGAKHPRETLASIIAETGIPFSAHDLRRTFATIAAARLPGYVVKRLLNHADGGDVTLGHYVQFDEATMRTAWQLVADAIVPARPQKRVANGNVVSLHGGKRQSSTAA